MKPVRFSAADRSAGYDDRWPLPLCCAVIASASAASWAGVIIALHMLLPPMGNYVAPLQTVLDFLSRAIP